MLLSCQMLCQALATFISNQHTLQIFVDLCRSNLCKAMNSYILLQDTSWLYKILDLVVLSKSALTTWKMSCSFTIVGTVQSDTIENEQLA
jgi:hypothetical protein